MITQTAIYTAEQRARLDPTRIPQHIAITPDGNRRWARKQMENLVTGHYHGANTLIKIVHAAKELGVKALTIYSFSTENWNRSRNEIDYLMDLIQDFLTNHCEEMKREGIRLKTIGDVNKLPEDTLKVINSVKKITGSGTQIDMILALNYGARDEIKRAVQQIIEDCAAQKLSKEAITENVISQYLDTAPWRDPELFIRTSGEKRLSNFLLWQLSYSEVYTTDVLWPDFTPDEFLEAIVDFQKRERRLGGA